MNQTLAVSPLAGGATHVSQREQSLPGVRLYRSSGDWDSRVKLARKAIVSDNLGSRVRSRIRRGMGIVSARVENPSAEKR
jgi:hypothetical protein